MPLKVAVQVQDVDVVGLQAAQAGLDFAQHPDARVVALVGPLRHRIAQLGGQHPVVPVPWISAPTMASDAPWV
jgi:hypothetical protein